MVQIVELKQQQANIPHTAKVEWCIVQHHSAMGAVAQPESPQAARQLLLGQTHHDLSHWRLSQK